jgi:ribose-phosphate pyrophosphokinase
VDDLIDTGRTFVGAAEALKKQGAKDIYGAVTHPLFSGNAVERINKSPVKKLYVMDTIPFKNHKSSKKIVQVSSSEIFGEAILRTYNHESISSLFDIDKG